ncbi:MAG: hypothetical protein WBL61_23260 [Bryobacteraceae bacterium]
MKRLFLSFTVLAAVAASPALSQQAPNIAAVCENVPNGYPTTICNDLYNGSWLFAWGTNMPTQAPATVLIGVPMTCTGSSQSCQAACQIAKQISPLGAFSQCQSNVIYWTQGTPPWDVAFASPNQLDFCFSVPGTVSVAGATLSATSGQYYFVVAYGPPNGGYEWFSGPSSANVMTNGPGSFVPPPYPYEGCS